MQKKQERDRKHGGVNFSVICGKYSERMSGNFVEMFQFSFNFEFSEKFFSAEFSDRIFFQLVLIR